MSKRSLLHGGSLRGPPIPPASGRRQYEGIENGGLDFLKTAAGICILSARKQPAPQRFFSFPVGRGRVLSCITSKKPITTSKIALCVIGSASVRLAL